MKNKNKKAALTAHLSHVPCLRSVIEKVPKEQLKNKIEVKLVNSGSEWGRSARIAQCKAYCEYNGQNQNIDAGRAAVCHILIGSATTFGMASDVSPTQDTVQVIAPK